MNDMDVLDRLHQKLLDSVLLSPSRLPLTVGEIYQNLIPYRAVRSDLGVWELALYEHALLRLLAGECGYAVIDDRAVRAEIVRELAAPNPILGIYRDYAAVGVRLAAAPVPAAPEVPAALATDFSTKCVSCQTLLPDVADLFFCPMCGADQSETPCAGCGIPLRDAWNYCVRCGRRRADRGQPVVEVQAAARRRLAPVQRRRDDES